MTAAYILLFTLFFMPSYSHSMIGIPRSFGPKVCRIGGDPNPGNCPGPCDLSAKNRGYKEHVSPSDPAAVIQRGGKFRIKYQRNNHGPGGFVRHTLVPIRHMMSKPMHERFAFHYSCWGAKSKLATAQDMKENSWGYSTVGNDGKTAPTSFYETTITIPPCIPDGNYVFGWVWYGGTGGPVYNEPITSKTPKPKTRGFFTDYWSCAYVRVRGGAPLQGECYPEFVNDIPGFSSNGCYTGRDDIGMCKDEPCISEASYTVPKPFKNGARPPPITPDMYTSTSSTVDGLDSGSRNNGQSTKPPVQTTEPTTSITLDNGSNSTPNDQNEGGQNSNVTVEDDDIMLDISGGRIVPATVTARACRCVRLVNGCGLSMARRTEGLCRAGVGFVGQNTECIHACCKLCVSGNRLGDSLCKDNLIKLICSKYSNLAN